MTSRALSELSILIVTWNGDDLLKNGLDSVARDGVVRENAMMAPKKTVFAMP